MAVRHRRDSKSCRGQWCGNLIWKTLAYPCYQPLPRLPNEILDRRLRCLCSGVPKSWRASSQLHPLKWITVPVDTGRTDHIRTSHGISRICFQQSTSKLFLRVVYTERRYCRYHSSSRLMCQNSEQGPKHTCRLLLLTSGSQQQIPS